MSGDREPGADRSGPPDLREPTPAERVRALPLVSVALGSMALGFCLVYFVCRPTGTDRSASSRPLNTPDATAQTPAVVHGSATDLRTDVDAAGAPVPPVPPPPIADAGGATPVPPENPTPPTPPPVPPTVPPPATDAGAPPPAPGLNLARVDVRKCAGADGIDVPRERCGRVRGIELFMTRYESTVRDCFDKSFADVPRPSQIAVTLDVDFTNKARRVSVPGSDEARARNFVAFKDCLEAGIGQPEYARIDHPLETYRFVFLYDWTQ